MQELPYPRKQRLAAGLLKGAGLLHLAKGIWVAALIAPKIPSVAVVIAIAHVGLFLLYGLIGKLATRKPGWATLAIFLLLIGLQVNYLPNHPSMELPTIGTMAMALLQILPNWIGLLALDLLLGDTNGCWRRHTAKLGSIRGLMTGLLVLFGLVVCMELGLRQIGMVPGRILRDRHYQGVDRLESHQDYWTDSQGIYAISAAARRCLAAYLSDPKSVLVWPRHLGFEINWVAEEYRSLQKRELATPFSRHLDSLLKLPPNQLDSIDHAYLDLASMPVNADGFRSIPFENHRTAKKKVLLLGDSFTWGHSATYSGFSFADRLIAQGFAVYNSGISASDPAQYQAIANKYIPVIRPDVVVVNLYLGNDIFYFDRPVVPFRPPWYRTNAGTIMAYPGPEWLPTPESAYQFAIAETQIPAVDSLPLNRFCSKTILGTLLWKAADGAGYVPFVRPNRQYWQRCAPLIQPKPVTGVHIQEIARLSAASGAQFVCAVIPEFPEQALNPGSLRQKFTPVFDSLEFFVPTGLTDADYLHRGGHFNDAGHQRYAAWLGAIIANPSTGGQ